MKKNNMRKYNLTYEQLIKLAPKDRPFQIMVESNVPKWACIINNRYLQFCFDEEDGTRILRFKDKNATVTLIDEYRNMYEKPEVLEVGTEVEILEDGKVVKTGKIYWVYTYNADGVAALQYDVELNNENDVETFPHYCVRPVEKVEEKEEGIPEFEDTISQLENLVTQAQDIIKKYKLIEE